MLILQMKRSNPNFFAKKCRLNLTSGLICGILGEDGALAQLGARHIRIVEAVGSNPICSIVKSLYLRAFFSSVLHFVLHKAYEIVVNHIVYSNSRF